MRLNKLNSFRHIYYEQQGGYLFLPVFIMLVFSFVAIILPMTEQNIPHKFLWLEKDVWLAPSDPAIAQLFLGAIAGSCITVLSVVYSVLLIVLTFASIQFSPRILTSFLKDRVTQYTLGLFIGTFAYCLICLPSIHQGQDVFVPRFSLIVALFLASACLFVLIYFIHHIALAIQVNYIVDRISRETEVVLRNLFGESFVGAPRVEEPLSEPDGATAVSTRSGYIQYLDEGRLLAITSASEVSIFVHRSVGQFIPAGIKLITISPVACATDALATRCLACFHLGPLRSMQDDVEFGVLQLVDIALKAISPAVNDPSTAIACIDHLSSFLAVAATLEPPVSRVFDERGLLRITRRQTSFPRLLEIAYNQIGPYGKNDMAVSLRLMRALQDISTVTAYPPYLEAIEKQARRVAKACKASFLEEDCQELLERLANIQR